MAAVYTTSLCGVHNPTLSRMTRVGRLNTTRKAPVARNQFTTVKNVMDNSRQPAFDVIIAGGGLAGLFLAICLIRNGMNVVVLEKTKQYRPLGGPIQLASNGLGVVHAISPELAESIYSVSRPFWGTRSGIRDGLTSEWMFTFDAITDIPATQGMPFSICIDRSDLQAALLDEIDRICTQKASVVRLDAAVAKYIEMEAGVHVTLENGEILYGDLLVGADGIWSTIRSQMFGEPSNSVEERFAAASFTGFKLFSGLPLCKSDEFLEIGYSAFIGPDHYFVVCPDRFGRVQWYAFIKATPQEPEVANAKTMLTKTFANWAPQVKELILATKEDEIVQRDLLDRVPSISKSWASSYVTLLGDSCHATMPNIGQGTGLAFEDGYVLASMLSDIASQSEIPRLLQKFYKTRILRTAIVQGLGRLNSEAIKLLTPLLPIRPVVDFMLSPMLPSIFYLQFAYCYSFCPVKIPSDVSKKRAAAMEKRHRYETEQAWNDDSNHGIS